MQTMPVRGQEHDIENVKSYRSEVITDQRHISAFNAASVPQSLLFLHMGFGVGYVALAFTSDVFFDFAGMRNWWCPVLGLLVVLEIAGYILYLRRTRLQRRDAVNPNLPTYIMGKPLKKEIDSAVLSSVIVFCATLWICIQYVAAGQTSDGLIGKADENLYTNEGKYAEYRNYVAAFFVVVLYGIRRQWRALYAHYAPVCTVTMRDM